MSERLILSSVKLASPGFWEVLGTLNPLEVTRQYLNDRHERRKDRDYRESAEKRRLELENFSRETKLISEWISIAKEAGLTPREIAAMLKALVYDPLVALDHYQDREIIDSAEIVDD
jgi:hypothetical protein